MINSAKAIDEIFWGALQLVSSEQRAEYLDERCGGDPDLRELVEKLLRAQPKAEQFLEKPIELPPPTSDCAGERAGAQIGPYKLLQVIGEGGMGVVYMAEQSEPVQRKVALKIIKPGMDTRQVIARFEAERQALAMMDHPNIAKVFDAGTTDSGRPYFVMELVRGIPITKYCDEQHLTLKQRLELFIHVCQAVQHAHQKGIIHRDLKPTNVLVAQYDDKPVPKVIDFGVAKAAQKLTERTMFTEFGQVVGTLEYMSPEQARLNQLDIDTRSDIYSLGVILYELLTGCTPFDAKRLRSAAFDEMLRIIREEEPPRPSTRLSTADTLPSIAANRSVQPARLSRTLRGELDWIVMKTLEKDRNRRYETASSLAKDLERYLSDEPVQACPPSVAYKLRTFARRNRVGLAVGALVLFFLLLLVSGVGWALRDRSMREAAAAQQQRERQAKVAGEVASIFGEVDRLEKGQKWPEALEAARRAAAAVAGGESDLGTAERVRQRLRDLLFIDRLEQIRIGQAELAKKFDNAGRDQEYARAFREYGADVEELPVETSIARLKVRPALAVALAAALDDWGIVRRQSSEVESERDVDRWKRLVAVARGIDSDPLRDQIRATWDQPGGNVRRLADSIDVRGQHPATLILMARRLYTVSRDAGVRFLQEAQQLHPGDFWLNSELGDLLRSQNDHDGSIRFHTAAVAIRPRSSRAHGSLGLALLDKGRLGEAIAEEKKVIELEPTSPYGYGILDLAWQRKGGVDEAITGWNEFLQQDPRNSQGHLFLGRALQRKGDSEGAYAEFRKATELDPNDATARGNFAAALLSKGRLDETIAVSKEVIELDPTFLYGYENLDLALQRKGDADETISEWKKIVERYPKNAGAHTWLGFALGRKGDLKGAYAQFRKAIEVDPKSYLGYEHLFHALERYARGDEAIAEWRKVTELHPRDYRGHNRLALSLEREGRTDEAIAEWKKTIELKPTLLDVRNYIGLALRKKGRLDEAIDAFRKTIELDPEFADSYVNLADALRAKGQLDDAVAALHTAMELNPQLAKAHSVMSGLAVDSSSQGRSADALRLIDELLADADRPGEDLRQDSLTILLCVQHFRRLGDPSACQAAAKALEQKLPSEAGSLYNAACCRALTGAAQAQANGPDAARLTKEEADRAMAWLTKAVAADSVDVAHINKDADLDSLRDREDFRKLLAVPRARYYIRLSQWDRAAAEYAQADLATRPLDDDAFAHACLFLIREDGEGYNRFCEDMILRAGQTQNHFEAFVLARSCAMTKKSAVDPARAVEWANQAVGGSRAPWYLHARGLTQYRAGQFKEALQSFTEANVETWRHGRGLNWFGLALVHHSLGQPDQARRCLDRGIQWLKQEGPTGPGLPAKHQAQDWLEALLLHREAEELLAAEAAALRERQLADAQEAVRLKPDDPLTHTDLGAVLVAQSKLDEAIEEFRAALRIKADDGSARDQLDWALNERSWTLSTALDTGKRGPSRAIKLATEAVELAPTVADFWNTLGVARYRAGDWEEAIVALQKYREFRTNEVEWSNPFFLAMVHWQLGNKDEARQWNDKGAEWMEERAPNSQSLRRFRSEADQLLGVVEKED